MNDDTEVQSQRDRGSWVGLALSERMALKLLRRRCLDLLLAFRVSHVMVFKTGVNFILSIKCNTWLRQEFSALPYCR